MDLTKHVTEKELEEITKSSVYDNNNKRQWELWYVNTQGVKDLIGICSYKLGSDSMEHMVQEIMNIDEAWAAGELPTPIFDAVDFDSFQGNVDWISYYLQ